MRLMISANFANSFAAITTTRRTSKADECPTRRDRHSCFRINPKRFVHGRSTDDYLDQQGSFDDFLEPRFVHGKRFVHG